MRRQGEVGGVYKRYIDGVKLTGCGMGFSICLYFPSLQAPMISTLTHGVGPSCSPFSPREFPVSPPSSDSTRIPGKFKKYNAKTTMRMEMVKRIFFLCPGMLSKSNEFEAHTQMTKTPAYRILQSSATAESLRHRGFAVTLLT